MTRKSESVLGPAKPAEEAAKEAFKEPKPDILYSETYQDDLYEYRHARLPNEMKGRIPPRVMAEHEWRKLGVDQASNWQHFATHLTTFLMFRRPLPGLKKGEEAAQVPGSAKESVASHNEQ